jgi:hypothetical protein
MIQKYYRTVLIFCAAILMPGSLLLAQSGRSIADPMQNKHWSVGFQAGPYLFLGDLPFTGGEKAGTTWAYGGFVEKQFLPWLSVRGQALNGDLSGQGSFYDSVQDAEVNAYFRAKVFEYNLGVIIHFAGLKGENIKPSKWQWYALLGAGFSNYSTRSFELETDRPLAGNGNGSGSGIGGRTLHAIVPVGIGVKYELGRHFQLNIESTLRPVNSDIQDATPGGFSKDMAWFTGLGLRYQFVPGKSKSSQLLNYTTSPDRISMKYRNLSFDLAGTRKLRDGANPLVSTRFPKRIGTQESFVTELQIANDRMPGVADIDIVLPDGFDLKTREIEGSILDIDDRVINLYTPLPVNDTVIRMELEILSANAPVGNHPFYTGYKLTDRDGESVGQKKVDYVEKDLLFDPDGRKIVQFNQGVEFRVQLYASAGEPVPADKLRLLFPIREKILEDMANGFYQYTTGSFKTVAEAEQYKEQLVRELGLDNLFVVFFQNGTRISSFDNAKPREQYIRSYERVPSPARVSVSSGKVYADEFRVEIRRSVNDKLSITEVASIFETPEPLTEVFDKGTYYYYAGSFKREDVAKAYLDYLVDRYGMVTARIGKFLRGKRVD